MELLNHIPEIFIQFVIVVLLSLLIGLEQRKLQEDKDNPAPLFGTDRSFAFIGMLGFILYILDKESLMLFISGLFILSVLLGIFYFSKIQKYGGFGFTTVLVALLTYILGFVVVAQPKWLTISIVVTILILVERKEYFQQVTTKLHIDEFISLAKFLIIAGVILPILPKEPVIPIINIPAYQIWLTVVVVSSISYLSYLLQKFVFTKSGVVVSGMLGGLYSSTATTLVLSKRSRDNNSDGSGSYASALILATAMMYIRILILMFIFNSALGSLLFPYFLILIAVSGSFGLLVYFRKKSTHSTEQNIGEQTNPLELKIASVFGALFIFFSVITHYTINEYGSSGLNVLSFIVGFTDIDPFLLNLFQGNYRIEIIFIAKAVLQAIISNNILKGIYTLVLADRITKKFTLIALLFITLINILIIFLI
jgi:uncharacterized membrane protein (DUF4010 family)